MRIAVIGAGSGGLALCYELKRMGHSVFLWNRNPQRLQPILDNGNKVDVDDANHDRSTIILDRISGNLGESVEGADAAIVVTPSNAHEEIGERFGSLGSFDAPVILMPGRTYGSYAFTKHFAARAPGSSVTCLETQTILHACRSDGNRVRIFGTKKKVLYTSLFPLLPAVRATVAAILPCFEYVERYFDVALNNVGAFFHPIPTILNSGWIESQKRFKHYTEGITPRIADFIDKIDREKESLCARIGVKHIPLSDWLEAEYGAAGSTLYERIQDVAAYREIDAPTTLDHRYIADDLNTGLVPLYRTAEHFGIPMPTLKVFLDFACAFMGTDYLATGRGFPSECWADRR